ncbi:MAG TPA: DUF2268 domain-containing putative Zn-dependent protease, partial [Longimicrobiales bacterium]|nr:DUF2268 domain-containing putative Zn-dependent protease [Longimicrobiales bacterium]
HRQTIHSGVPPVTRSNPVTYRALAFQGLAAIVLLTPASSAQAQRAALNPVGAFTLIARDGDTEVRGVLTIVSQNGPLSARIVIAGQPEITVGTVKVEGQTITLSDRVENDELTLVLTFDTDSTFSGRWSLGAQSGTITGQRGVKADPGQPSCPSKASEPALPAERRPGPEPDSARIITSDVRLFWSVLDRSTPETLTQLLHCDYLMVGTQAVRDFIPSRIISAARLAELVTSRRDRYEAARQSSLTVDTMEQPIRAVFRRLKGLYPAAVFPDVYFVVGRFNTGGTVSQRGLLIGAEMYANHGGVTNIVAHELVHYQQKPILAAQRSLLSQSVMEGSADFVAELISDHRGNSRAHEYALPRERELWQEFTRVMNGRDYAGWLYGNAPEGRPADIGYFFGYRIAQAYYARLPDKGQALRDILNIADYAEFFRRSGYDPR